MLHYFIASAMAQDGSIALPPVPTVGVSPVLQWMMGVTTVVLSVSLPIAVALAKQYFNLQNVQTRANLINGSVTRAAETAFADQQKGMVPDAAIDKGLLYVKSAHPDQIAAVDQATDQHLKAAIGAEVSRIARQTPDLPITQAPVSNVVALDTGNVASGSTPPPANG